MATGTMPDLFPYKVEEQPDGRWAVVTPNLGALPEYTYRDQGDAITTARRFLRYDNE